MHPLAKANQDCSQLAEHDKSQALPTMFSGSRAVRKGFSRPGRLNEEVQREAGEIS
jgi:hypothetical protein